MNILIVFNFRHEVNPEPSPPVRASQECAMSSYDHLTHAALIALIAIVLD